jgi:hypothetical protein
MTEERKLAEIIARVIDLRDSSISISPSWVATEAMQVLDPERTAPMLVYAGCNLQLRQIARSQLRGRFQSDEDNGDKHDLFPLLQRRYPTSRSVRTDEPEYVLLEYLSDVDIGFNVARLRAEAMAKLAHADALQAYGKERPMGANDDTAA